MFDTLLKSMNKLNNMCLKRLLSLILGHVVVD